MPKNEFVKRSLEPPDLNFAGKVAIITGGTRGIGAAAARRVAELGAKVVITGRRGREGRLLVDKIKRNDGAAAFIQADLTRPTRSGSLCRSLSRPSDGSTTRSTMPEFPVTTGR